MPPHDPTNTDSAPRDVAATAQDEGKPAPTLFFHREASLGKLRTKEDPIHLHKTLGILSILSFAYRYGWCYNTTGTLGFSGRADDWLGWLTMAVHTLLACSSMLFRVPRKRLAASPLVIYEEYRQHAAVFSLGIFLVYAQDVLFPDRPAWASFAMVMAAHAAADVVTWRHGNGNTAVRAVASGAQAQSWSYQLITKAYSYYQFLALAAKIVPFQAGVGALAFNAIIAIASSAFLMTLYRKRIIKGAAHLGVYSLCLLLSSFHFVRLCGWTVAVLALVVFLLRINLPRRLSNKYVLWTGFWLFLRYDGLGYLGLAA